jgi:hypothetical protein
LFATGFASAFAGGPGYRTWVAQLHETVALPAAIYQDFVTTVRGTDSAPLKKMRLTI